MKLDDRFMTIFTVLGLILGLGTLMNRGEDGASLFGGPGTYVAQADVFTLRAGRVQSLDVLLNDLNYERVNADELEIVKAPSCGSALAVAGTIQYADSETCEGKVVLAYCVPFEDACNSTTVTLNILKVENIPVAVSSAGTGEPMIMTELAQGRSPSQPTQLASRQPVRLEAPKTSAVNISPAAAVKDIRGRTDQVEVAILVDNGSDRPINVSNESARAGKVATNGVSLQAPTLEGESSNISIASASRPNTSAPRAAAPQGFGAGVGQLTINVAPSSPSLPSQGRPAAPQIPTSKPIIQAGISPATTQPKPPLIAQPQKPVVATPDVAPASSDVQIASADLNAQSQLRTPGAADTPNSSGVVSGSRDTDVLLEIARSNSILGVTVSAAKDLLSSDANVTVDKSSAIPRPRNFEVANGIGNDNFPIIESARNIPLPQIEAPVAAEAPAPVNVVASLDNGRNELVFKRISRPAQKPTPNVVVQNPIKPIKPAQDEPVVASLTTKAPNTTEIVKPVQTETACGIDMSLKARKGAELVATVVSPCRPGQSFEVDHAGLVFTAVTDLDGVSNFIVPAMASNAIVSVQFGDGASKEESIQVPNMERVTRVAVMWSADIDFDIHAREFGARTGDKGHIWSDQPGDYSTARRAGGGYLTLLGPKNGTGNKAEVYTVIRSSRTQSGLIDLSLELAGFGNECDANPIISTIRSEDANVERDRALQLSLGDCVAGQTKVVKNAIQDIRIARR